jgi:hypothetical protein
MSEAAHELRSISKLMPLQSNQVGTASWRRFVICLALTALLLGGIRLHALEFTSAATPAVSSGDPSQTQRQSLDSDVSYCIAPPGIFAFEPAPAVCPSIVQAQDVFLPSHPDGWYCNRPPPCF